jgi:hypothetical protein
MSWCKGLAALLGTFLVFAASLAAAQRSLPSDAAHVDEAVLASKAHDIVVVLSERFRAEIAAALKSDGAAGAMSLCQAISADLPTTASDESGFEITRTSLKLRNPENAPDEWETRILQDFQKKASEGMDISRLEYGETTTSPEGDKLFRYMKAIPMVEQCVACHGTDIKPDVKAEISRYYPEDKAYGYKVGELRGAFSLVQLIEE